MSEGSSSSARQTLYGLGSRYAIDVLDPSPICQCRFSSLVRKWYRCPRLSTAPGAYLKCLARRLRGGRYDVLFPTHEQVYLLSRYRDALARLVAVALPEFAAVRQLQDKAAFARLLAKLRLPAPATVVVRGRAELGSACDFPCYVKIAHSTAGYGVKFIRSAGELSRKVGELEEAGAVPDVSEFVVQQPARGTQCVVQAVFQHGRLLAAHCTSALALGIGGGQMVRVSVSHPAVVGHMRRVGEHLGWHGPMFAEYFYDAAAGTPQYIEANPRIGETANARLSGVNFCELVVQISLGREVEPLGPTRAGVRSHNGFLVLLAAALDGAGRRQLLGQWRRLRRGEGIYRDCQNEMTRPGEDRASVIPAGGTLLELLATPKLSHRVVQGAVKNYALPEAAVRRIDNLPANALDRYLHR